jgi:hypothetical protein
MKPETAQKLREFIDALEEDYGNVEGFEVSLEHPILNGERQSFADIKEFVVLYLKREIIEIK